MNRGIFECINILLISACAVVSATRQYHMLQQNSYFISRYFGWLRISGDLFLWGCMVVDLLVKALLVFIPGIHPAFLTGYCAFSLLVLVVHTRSVQKKAIKKLVVTARVKRMYLTASLLCLLAGAATLLFDAVWVYFMVLLLIFSFSPILSVLSVVFNEPIEKSVRMYYINDAKKKLRSMNNLMVFGVTGSYGKTSSKYVLERILSEKYNVCMTPGNLNTPLGVVRTIRENLTPECNVFICEMGAKNIGDIKEICDIVHPDLGIITSVGPQHLSTFKTVENVAATKFELADAVVESGGKVFLNSDSKPIEERASSYASITYGVESKADVRAENITCSREGSSFDVCIGERSFRVSTKLLGKHNVLNVLGAVAVADYMGVSDDRIKFALSRLVPIEHRLQLKPFLNGSVLIDDAYNSNPEGSKEAVSVLGSFEGMKKIIVTPGMVELGEKEYSENYDLGLKIADVCDRVLLVGEKRAVPFVDALTASGYDMSKVTVCPSFKDAMKELSVECSRDTAVLFENDLPDNYAG